jgi:hypothetical protein
MKPFELRFFDSDGALSLIMHQFLSSRSAAIRSAKTMARGRAFEIWRGKECVFGIGDDVPIRYPKRS